MREPKEKDAEKKKNKEEEEEEEKKPMCTLEVCAIIKLYYHVFPQTFDDIKQQGFA